MVQEVPETVNDEAEMPVTVSSAVTEKAKVAELLGVAGGVMANTGFLRSKVSVLEVASAIGPVVAPKTESAARLRSTVPSEQFPTVML